MKPDFYRKTCLGCVGLPASGYVLAESKQRTGPAKEIGLRKPLSGANYGASHLSERFVEGIGNSAGSGACVVVFVCWRTTGNLTDKCWPSLLISYVVQSACLIRL